MKESTFLGLIIIIVGLLFLLVSILPELGFVNFDLTYRISLSSLAFAAIAVLYPIWRDAKARENALFALINEVKTNEETLNALIAQEDLFRAQKGKSYSLATFQTIAIENAIRLNIFTKEEQIYNLHQLNRELVLANDFLKMIRDSHLANKKRNEFIESFMPNLRILKSLISSFTEIVGSSKKV